jgi:protease I
MHSLAGKRIAVLVADGFEQNEFEQPVAALEAAGAAVTVIALRAGRVRGMHVHQSADLAQVDKTVAAARADDVDGLLVPGGYISPDLLRQSGAARGFVRQVQALGKPIALMSQAPLLLVSCALAAGRTLTSWPGVRDDMVNAGAVWRNQEVVRYGNILTSRGPQDIGALIAALLPFFAGEEQADQADQAHTHAAAPSDPPRDEPSERPGQPLHWLSAPSVGAMLSLALLGVGVVAANRGLRKKRAGDAEPDPMPLETPS